jgi:hypothetical protein
MRSDYSVPVHNVGVVLYRQTLTLHTVYKVLSQNLLDEYFDDERNDCRVIFFYFGIRSNRSYSPVEDGVGGLQPVCF